MRTVTQQINLYKFDELSKEIQEDLIAKEIQIQHEIYCDNFLIDDMEEKAKNLLKKYFKEKATFNSVWYDLWCSQGSGAMIEFNLKYYNTILKIKHFGHYSHERSFIIENDYLIPDKKFLVLKEKIISMNIELKKFGYKLIDSIFTEGEAREYLIQNEYTINGQIF